MIVRFFFTFYFSPFTFKFLFFWVKKVISGGSNLTEIRPENQILLWTWKTSELKKKWQIVYATTHNWKQNEKKETNKRNLSMYCFSSTPVQLRQNLKKCTYSVSENLIFLYYIFYAIWAFLRYSMNYFSKEKKLFSARNFFCSVLSRLFINFYWFVYYTTCSQIWRNAEK